MTSQNIDPSSWDILYIKDFGIREIYKCYYATFFFQLLFQPIQALASYSVP
jgi:hypothetical protein